jgi:hypothetical protein
MTNKNRGDNASVEILHQDDSIIESLPFAVDDTLSSTTSRDHNNNNNNNICEQTSPSNKNNNSETSKYTKMTTYSTITCNSQNSSPSTPPGLVESMMTDATSCCSELSASNNAADVVTKSTINNCKIKNSPQPLTTTTPSTAAMSSTTFSISSLQSVNLQGKESNKFLPRQNLFPSDNDSINMGVSSSSSSSLVGEPRMIYQQQSEMSDSVGFSQLMQAADDSNIQLGQSHTITTTATTTPNLSGNRSNNNNLHMHMPPLLEHQELMESGALISAAPTNTNTSICDPPVISSTTKIRNWWPNILPSVGSSRTANHHELGTPLLTEIINTHNQINSASHVTRLLSSNYIQQQHANIALERARETVQIRIDDDESFEVSVLLGGSLPCTVDDVMDIISNADLLSLWCDPIETLIVISNSSDDSPMAVNVNVNVNTNANAARMSPDRTDPESVREYEGEWIEATTSVLESPSTSLSFIFNAGQRLLESLGFASYGRITMFVERRRGHVGLTIGPFHGGIHASHTIHVSEDANNSGSIRIVDRVRLTRDEEVLPLIGFLGCGVVGSCLSHCLLPSIVGYVDQVTTSMARLLLLLENNDILAVNSRPR